MASTKSASRTSVPSSARAFPAPDFSVGNGLLATNRHVAEPWYGDSEAQKLIDQGATGMLESLVVFFPGSPTPVNLSPASVSKTSDLAILHAEDY